MTPYDDQYEAWERGEGPPPVTQEALDARRVPTAPAPVLLPRREVLRLYRTERAHGGRVNTWGGMEAKP